MPCWSSAGSCSWGSLWCVSATAGGGPRRSTQGWPPRAIAWFTLVGAVPTELVAYAPQVTTLVVLALARQDLRPPAAIGLPYRRGEQT